MQQPKGGRRVATSAEHYDGFNWTDSSCAGEFPTNAEVATAANWDRKYAERKQIAISALLTLNG